MEQTRIVTSGGHPVWVAGAPGPTVIFVHGVLMDHRMWSATVAALGDRYRVCCIDMLGHGDANDPPGERTLSDFVNQVAEVVEQFSDHGKPVLGGFSMGGMVTQGYAVAHSQNLAGVVILNAVYERNEKEQNTVRERSQAMSDGGVQAAIDSANARWFVSADRQDQPELVEATLQWMRDGDFSSKVKAHRVFSRGDIELAGKLGQIRCPALVMTGDGDGGSTPAMAERMAAAIPDAQLHVLDGQRHMMPVLDAERVNPIIRRFLDEKCFAS
ncbi:MAG: alpha/beta hydrolase [Pseudomonadota bacterium]